MIAILVTCALSVVICFYAAAWFVVTSISTICLYLAYGIPIYLNPRNRRRGTGEFMTNKTAFWSLGRWSPAINAIAIAWIVIITIVFMASTKRARALDDARVSDCAHAALRFSARRRFHGPPIV